MLKQKTFPILSLILSVIAFNAVAQPNELAQVNIFFENVAIGNIEQVNSALKINPNLIHAENSEGESALMLASLMAHEDLVELLLKRGSQINKNSHNGSTALHKAMFKGTAKQIKTLIDAGAVLNTINEDMDTPLSSGIFADNNDAVEYLASIMPNFRSEVDACYCIFIAISNNSKKMLTFLLKNGANPNIRKPDGRTPLIDAANEREDLLTSLLQAGADKHLKDNQGYTALSTAQLLKRSKAIEILSQP